VQIKIKLLILIGRICTFMTWGVLLHCYFRCGSFIGQKEVQKAMLAITQFAIKDG
jgi:hypothetical protein